MASLFSRAHNATPSGETAWQLSENITVFTICCIHTSVVIKESHINTWG